MNRKEFLASVIGLVIFGLLRKKEKLDWVRKAAERNAEAYRKAFIFNDDGSKRLCEFDDIRYADYFQLIESDGELVVNEDGDDLFLATSNLFYNKDGVLTVDTYQDIEGYWL